MRGQRRAEVLGSKAIAGDSREEKQGTPWGARSVIFVTHSPGLFPQLFYLWSLEIVLIPLFLNFNMRVVPTAAFPAAPQQAKLTHGQMQHPTGKQKAERDWSSTWFFVTWRTKGLKSSFLGIWLGISLLPKAQSSKQQRTRGDNKTAPHCSDWVQSRERMPRQCLGC